MNDTASAIVAQSPSVPNAFLPYSQFVLWRLEQRPGEPKPRKVPIDPRTGHRAAVDDPATWADYATAYTALSRFDVAGMGFVFTTDDPFVFLDLDDCRDPTTGTYAEHATAIHAALPGAWEVSQSGKGLHGVGRLDDPARLTGRAPQMDRSGHRQQIRVLPIAAFHGDRRRRMDGRTRRRLVRLASGLGAGRGHARELSSSRMDRPTARWIRWPRRRRRSAPARGEHVEHRWPA